LTHTGYQHAPDFDAPLAAMRLVEIRCVLVAGMGQ